MKQWFFSGTGYILKLKKHEASSLLFPDKLVEYPEVPKISACHYPCLLSSRSYLKTSIFGMWPGYIWWFRTFVEVPNEGRWDQPLMIFFKILFAFDFKRGEVGFGVGESPNFSIIFVRDSVGEIRVAIFKLGRWPGKLPSRGGKCQVFVGGCTDFHCQQLMKSTWSKRSSWGNNRRKALQKVPW